MEIIEFQIDVGRSTTSVNAGKVKWTDFDSEVGPGVAEVKKYSYTPPKGIVRDT
jgi:hypothetical protein